MKNIFFFLCIALTGGLFSCEDTAVKDVFDESPEKRVDAAITELRNKLMDSEYGWSAYFLFHDGNNDTYLNLRFLPDDPAYPKGNNRVEIQYLNNENKQVYTEEVHYTMRYAQRVELIFDTYSHFAELVGAPDNGDFRFRLRKSEEPDRVEFDSFNDAEDGVGILYLKRADNVENFKSVQKMRSQLLNDGHKSFYRVLKLDGSEQQYVYYYQVDAVINWVENGVMKSVSSPVEATTDGCRFTKPLLLEGHRIEGMLFNSQDSSFFALENGQKIGVLDYVDHKPYVYPGAVKMFLEGVGADTSSIVITPIAFSYKLSEAHDTLRKRDPDFDHIIFQPCTHTLVFVNRANYYKNCYYKIDTEYGEDSMCFNWTGSAVDDNGNSYSYDYYIRCGDVLMDELVAQEENPVKVTWSITPRNGFYYFVRDDDPTVCFVGKPDVKG